MEWTSSQKGKPMLLLNGFAYVFAKRLKTGGEIWRCRMKRLGCSAYVHLDEDRKKILNSSTTPNHSNHGADFGECNSLIFKAKIKENSQTLDCRPEKVIMATTKQSKDFFKRRINCQITAKRQLTSRNSSPTSCYSSASSTNS